MKNYLPNCGRLFWIMPLILSFLALTPKCYSEEVSLKINLLNLDKPGILYFSICKDVGAFKRTVENESEEESCITSAEEIDLQNFQINSMLPRGEYAISLFVDSNCIHLRAPFASFANKNILPSIVLTFWRKRSTFLRTLC